MAHFTEIKVILEQTAAANFSRELNELLEEDFFFC